jgi:hypothetical protein
MSLTKFPTPAGAPALPVKTVRLFAEVPGAALISEDPWNGKSWTINLDDWFAGKRHTVHSSVHDQARYVAFNLPVGVVLTLTDNIAPLGAGQNAADLSGCGVCVELVGTGQAEALDLMDASAHNCVSAFFWRAVDLELGAIELFQHIGFKGNRSILFLSDWSPGEVHSIGKWWMNDKVSSARWDTLSDRVAAALLQDADGGGNSFDNIRGLGSMKECGDLQEFRFNDEMSSFRWSGLVPKKEIIAPFKMNIPADKLQTGVTDVQTRENQSDINQPSDVKFEKKLGRTISLSTTDTFVTGVKTTHGYNPGGAGGYEGSVEVSFSYERSKTATRTDTDETSYSVTQTINVPPKSRITATAFYALGTLPPTEYQTTAERWYDQPVTDAKQDPANNNWYKRVETIRVTLEGSLAVLGSVVIKQDHL